MTDRNNERKRFAICINHGGYPESLEVLKLYQVLPDPDAAQHRSRRQQQFRFEPVRETRHAS